MRRTRFAVMVASAALTATFWLGCPAGVGPGTGGGSVDESAPLQEIATAIGQTDAGDVEAGSATSGTPTGSTVTKTTPLSVSRKACLLKFSVFKFLKKAGYKDFVAFTVRSGKDFDWFMKAGKDFFEKYGRDIDVTLFPWDKIAGAGDRFDTPVLFVKAWTDFSAEPLVFIAASDLDLDGAAAFSGVGMVEMWNRATSTKPTGGDYDVNFTIFDSDYGFLFLKGTDEEVAAFKDEIDVTNIVSLWKNGALCDKVCSGNDAVAKDVFLSTSFFGAFAPANFAMFAKDTAAMDFSKSFSEKCYGKTKDNVRIDGALFNYNADWDLDSTLTQATILDYDSDYSYDAVAYDAATLVSSDSIRKTIGKENYEELLNYTVMTDADRAKLEEEQKLDATDTTGAAPAGNADTN